MVGSADYTIGMLIFSERRYKYRRYSIMQEVTTPIKVNDLGDMDLQAIFPILAASSIMLTPILNWSTQIRKHARAIAVCWGLLIFTAFVPTFLNVWKGVQPFFSYGQLFTCDIDIANNCSFEYLQENNSIISSDFYYGWVKHCHH